MREVLGRPPPQRDMRAFKGMCRNAVGSLPASSSSSVSLAGGTGRGIVKETNSRPSVTEGARRRAGSTRSPATMTVWVFKRRVRSCSQYSVMYVTYILYFTCVDDFAVTKSLRMRGTNKPPVSSGRTYTMHKCSRAGEFLLGLFLRSQSFNVCRRRFRQCATGYQR
ncbi:hypothetical protein N656DRAFT_7977 [Canariomyces notabilis]|uniref:Uncharacterized protein n=1 Tax=Canariomyces notabilis TaxID=2074819 RepID=A0AAN6YWV7_9PEZI|nr:hypothetical protein N656DRAFT_7977 [Canariomyces arenarius]